MAALSGPERARFTRDYTEYRATGLTVLGAARCAASRLPWSYRDLTTLTPGEADTFDELVNEAEKEFRARKENGAESQNSQERSTGKEVDV